MSVLLWGPGLFLCAFVVHLGVWRVRVPARQRRALVVLFAGVFAGAAVLGALADNAGGAAGRSAWLPAGPWGLIFSAVCFASLAAGYIALHIGLEVDSPTLTLVKWIDTGGAHGVTESELEVAVRMERFVRSRVTRLADDGQVVEECGRYRIAAPGLRLLGVYDAYARLAGRQGKSV